MDNNERAAEMCSDVPEGIRPRAIELAENVLWMESKLAEAREAIGRSQVAIPYDNGGGQTGIRKNPAFDGYNSLMSSYVKAVKQLCDMLGDDEPDGLSIDLDAVLTAKPKGRGKGKQ